MEKIDKLVEIVIRSLYRVIHKELSQSTLESYFQFFKFGIVGVSNTILSYVLNVVLLLVFQYCRMSPKIDYLAAQFVAFVISVAWSFYWNNKMVFVQKEGEIRIWWKVLLKTYISYSFTGVFLNSVLSWIWVNGLQISKFVAPLINLIISVPLNFLINKFWAFRTVKTNTDVE